MDVPDEITCGSGLAENSELPRALANVMAAMSDVLEAHRSALDLSDESSRLENDAYLDLVNRQRQIAAHLSAVAAEMAGHLQLRQGQAIGALQVPRRRAAFEKLVGCKQELSSLLREAVDKDQALLARMSAAENEG